MPSRFRNSRSSSASFRSRISRTPPTSLDTIFMTVPLSCVTLPTVLCTGRSRAEPQHLEEEAAEPACRWRGFTGAVGPYLAPSAEIACAMWPSSDNRAPAGEVVHVRNPEAGGRDLQLRVPRRNLFNGYQNLHRI